MKKKITLYQLFPRLFGNETAHPIPFGSRQENGCGTFASVNDNALRSLAELGITHIWFTGVPEHATSTDYSRYGITPDHPLVIKGRAGSPYAIKDYYDVHPDLAEEPENRMQEFKALIQRTHRQGLKVIIDFVPNHVARNYHADNLPEGHGQLGENDDPTSAFAPENNFYYLPEEPFRLPDEAREKCSNYVDLNTLEPYREYPAKASGNDCFTASPSINDWYETVKLNYGVDYQSSQNHFSPIPDTWQKMQAILLFWSAMGIDGFRCDMAEMVPVAFWHWAISNLKRTYPQLIFIAEVYNPDRYHAYLHEGQFDYLYDKVGLYDTLRNLTTGGGSIHDITHVWQNLGGLDPFMLRFMENHDEQRIASTHFAGKAERGLPAMVVSTLMHQGPVMIYNGQELGEQGDAQAGFSGDDGRTTIFDYWHMPEVQRWNHHGAFDGANLSPSVQQLRNAYGDLLRFAGQHPAISTGAFYDLMWINPHLQEERIYAFLRHTEEEKILIVASFNALPQKSMVTLNAHVLETLGMEETTQLQRKQQLPTLPEETSTYAKKADVFTLPITLEAFGYQAYSLHTISS